MKKINIRKKIYIFILMTTVILFVMFFAFLSDLMLKVEYQSYANDAQKRIDNLCYNADRIFYSVIDRSSNISNNKLVWDIINKEEHPDYFMSDLDFLKKFFSSLTEYENYITGQYHIYTNNETIPENIYFSDIERLKKLPEWDEIKNIGTSEFYWVYNDKEQKYVSAYSKIAGNSKIEGYLEIKIPLKQIENILRTASMDENERIVVTDKENNIIFSVGDIESSVKEAVFSGNVIPGFKFSMYAKESFIYQTCYIYLTIAAVFLFLLFIFVSFFYLWLIKKLTYDFDSFVDTLEKDENVLLNPQFIDEKDDGSVLKIKVKFKKLIQRINVLHKEIESINSEKKKIELATLQTSFNPHLLYNSLSVLKWRLYETDDELMMKMIDHMVEYYRSVLADGNNIITVSEEIELIKQYLQIVRISYNKEFTVTINIEDDVKDCYIIKQILQPAVENAVMHGLTQTDDARLEISVYKKENSIIFEVTDNGCGMESDVIESLFEEKTSKEGGRKKGYGIRNTVNRIKTYYGSEYGVFIESTPSKGTKVTLTAEYLEKKALSERMQEI